MSAREILIPGKPVAAARPRINHHTGNVYDPQAKQKGALSDLIREQMMTHGWEPFVDLPIEVELYFFFAIAPSRRKGIQYRLYDGDLHTGLPDLDNLVKFVLDSSKRMWKDDRQIAQLVAEKKWTMEPEGWTAFRVTPVPPHPTVG